MNKDVKDFSKYSYVSEDFASIYPDLLDLATTLTNKWHPANSNESDPGVVLLKEGAFMADHLNYNTDKNILESFLPTAVQESSVRNLVQMGGYIPNYYVSATGLVNFNYDFGTDEKSIFNLPTFTLSVSNKEGDISFIQTSPLYIDEKGYGNCQFTQGYVVDFEVNGETTITIENIDDDNRLYLKDLMVAQNGIFIRNANTNKSLDWSHLLWKRENYLNVLPPHTKAYKVEYDSDRNQVYIEFPSDISEIIESGLEIKYIVTSGLEGNIPAAYLSVVENPDTYTDDLDNTWEMKNFTLYNPSAIENGKNPETIEEMYHNYKEVVGTFNTLVTCKDFSNAIKQLEDDNNTRVVSNSVVTDTTNDYNNSLKIISYDEFGPYIESATMSFSSASNYIGNDSTLGNDFPFRPGNVVSQGVNLYLCVNPTNEFSVNSGDWSKVNDFRELAYRAENMSNNDLKLCALIPFRASRFSKDKPEYSMEATFTPVRKEYSDDSGLKGEVTTEEIKDSLGEYKCISTNFKPKMPEELYYFKIKTPLDIQVTTYEKISDKDVFESIKANIFRAITENFNSSMIEFGDSLDLDEVYYVILNSDSRIKNIYISQRDEDTQTVGVVSKESGVSDLDIDGTEPYGYYEIDPKPSLLLDLVSKNVLAGRLCLFNFVEDFSYNYGQEDNEFYKNLTSIQTVSEISSPFKNSIDPTFTGVDIDSTATRLKISIPDLDKIDLIIKKYNSASEEVPLSGSEIQLGLNESIVILPNYLNTNQSQISFYDDSFNQIGETLFTDYKLNTGFKFKSNMDEEITITIYGIGEDGGVYSLPSNSTDTLNLSESLYFYNAQFYPESAEFNIPEDRDRHFIYLSTPNYADVKTFPSFCYYRLRHVSGIGDTFEIPADQDVELPGNIILELLNKEGNDYVITSYTNGDIINSTFTISTDTFEKDGVIFTNKENKNLSKKNWGTNQSGYFAIITAGNTITHRELLETVLNDAYINCYWAKSGSSWALFDYEITDDNQIVPRNDTFFTNGNTRISTILNNGEYFFFTNSDKTTLAMFGPGTMISIPNNDFAINMAGSWDINEEDRIGMDSISSSGLAAGIPFREIHLTKGNAIYIQEMSIITLTAGDNLTLLSTKDLLTEEELSANDLERVFIITNNWEELTLDIRYSTSAGGPYTLIKSRNNPYYIKCDFVILDDSNGVTLSDYLGSEENSIKIKERLCIGTNQGKETLPLDLYEKNDKGERTEDLWNEEIKRVLSNFSLSGLTSNLMNLNPVKEYLSLDNMQIMLYGLNLPVVYKKEGSDPEPIEGIELDVGELNFNTDDYETSSVEDETIIYSSYLKAEIPFFFNRGVEYVDIPQEGTGGLSDIDRPYYYVIPIYLTGNTKVKFPKDHPIKATLKLTELDTENLEETQVTQVELFDLGETESYNEFEMVGDKPFYLLSFNSEEVEKIRNNAVLTLEWKYESDEQTGSAYINVLPIKVYNGTNNGIAYNSYETLDQIMVYMKELVKNSTKANTNIYYINEPDNTLAIQDDNIMIEGTKKFNPAFLYDKNNIANILTLPMIDIANSDVYLTKSVKGYKD